MCGTTLNHASGTRSDGRVQRLAMPEVLLPCWAPVNLQTPISQLCRGLAADHAHEAHAFARLAAQVVGQPQLLAHGPGQEAPFGMSLPARRLHQLFRGDAARPLEQVQDFGSLTAVAGTGGFLGAFGRILRRGGLLTRLSLLRRNMGATWRNTRPFCRFRLLASRWGLGRRRVSTR